MIARFHTEGTPIGQTNLSGYVGRNAHFELDMVSHITPLAFNGSHRGVPFCFCVSQFLAWLWRNGQEDAQV